MPLIVNKYSGPGMDTAYWRKPDSITIAERNHIKEYLGRVRQNYPAPTKAWLSGRIATLLSHYFLATKDQGLNKAIAMDWIHCLDIFPEKHLEKAVQYWRDNESRKPKPSDIRKLAIRFFGETDWEKIMRLKTLYDLPCSDRAKGSEKNDEWTPPTDEQKKKVAEMVKNITKEKGI